MLEHSKCIVDYAILLFKLIIYQKMLVLFE